MRQAQQSLESGEAQRAVEAEQRALAALEQARAALEERARQLEGRREETQQALAEAQRKLAQKAEALAREAQALAPQQAQSKQAAQEAASALERAAASMQQAGAQGQQGQRSAAQQSQQQAEQALEQAQRSLEKAASETQPSAQLEQRLKQLKEQQEALRQRLKQLEDLLKKTENPEAQESAQSAQRSMEETQDRLEAGDAPKSKKSAEEARKYLEQAQEELEKEKRRYQSLEQEELLFRLVRDLKEIRAAQQALRKESAEAVAEAERLRSGGGRLSRARKIRLKAMAAEENALADKLAERHAAVLEEGSTAFAALLEETVQDVREVARLLEQPDEIGPLLLGLEDEVLHRLDDLIGGFDDELERRQQDPQQGQGQQGQQGQQGGQGRPKLVPFLVEIKLLRRQQMDLNHKVRRFFELYPDVREGRLGETERRALERLYHQQGRIKRVLEDLVESALQQDEGGG